MVVVVVRVVSWVVVAAGRACGVTVTPVSHGQLLTCSGSLTDDAQAMAAAWADRKSVV